MVFWCYSWLNMWTFFKWNRNFYFIKLAKLLDNLTTSPVTTAEVHLVGNPCCNLQHSESHTVVYLWLKTWDSSPYLIPFITMKISISTVSVVSPTSLKLLIILCTNFNVFSQYYIYTKYEPSEKLWHNNNFLEVTEYLSRINCSKMFFNLLCFVGKKIFCMLIISNLNQKLRE